LDGSCQRVTASMHSAEITSRVRRDHRDDCDERHRTPSTCPANPGNNGFRFGSNPASTTISNFAQIGSEHNGVFFPALLQLTRFDFRPIKLNKIGRINQVQFPLRLDP
jgi:hypothetical protein